MEFKTYSEIDLNETPIAILGCGHFFTGETLDGMLGMSNVYTTDKLGNYNGLKELSGQLMGVPACPDCRVPIRQFATKRYNRVVNKAVLDETSKRFLVGGRETLAQLDKKVAAAEKQLSSSEGSTVARDVAIKLHNETAKFRREMAAEHQPTKLLFDAAMTLQRVRREQPLEQTFANLTLSEPAAVVPQPVYDQQITLNAYRLQLRLQEALLRDGFTLLAGVKRDLVLTAFTTGSGAIDKRAASFLRNCQTLIDDATTAKLPRLVIPTILSYARIAQFESWHRRTMAATTTTPTTTTPTTAEPPTPSTPAKQDDTKPTPAETARTLLIQALALCDTLPSIGAAYREEVQATAQLFAETRYEAVTPAELTAIKKAMVEGRAGLSTHSGHWYTCRNGHPVSSPLFFSFFFFLFPPGLPGVWVGGKGLVGWVVVSPPRPPPSFPTRLFSL